MLASVFEDDFVIMEASDGQEALDLMKSHNRRIAAVLLDVIMPGTDGITALRRMKKREYHDRFPTFLITSDTSKETVEEGFKLGAADIILKPFVASFISRRIRNVIELYAARGQLSETVMLQNDKIESMRRDMFEGLVSVIEFRDAEGLEKSHRVHTMTKRLLEQLGKYDESFKCTDEEIEKISLAAILHDIGKLMIPDSILNKEGHLDPEEEKIMQTHTVNGAKMLHQMLDREDPIYRYAYDICRHHHERFDGRGYPDRLVRNEITIPAQVVGLVDAYDALRHGRAGRGAAVSHEVAVKMILNGECGAFSQPLLDCFEENADKMKN